MAHLLHSRLGIHISPIMLQHLILTLAILSPFHPVTSAAIIPTPTYDVDPSFNTESPGPIPAEYAILNTTYLNQLDASHGPSNNTSLNLTSSGLLGGRAAPRDNCKGSHYCSWAPWFSAKADHLSCELAYMKFNPNAYYMRYASYTESKSRLTSNSPKLGNILRAAQRAKEREGLRENENLVE